jgi:hypothetical protein
MLITAIKTNSKGKLDHVGMDCFLYSNEDPLIMCLGDRQNKYAKRKRWLTLGLYCWGNFDGDKEEIYVLGLSHFIRLTDAYRPEAQAATVLGHSVKL